MKAKRIIYYILMFLPLAINLAALPFLPDQIPAHYGFDNQVNRWGSKYETLIFPIMTILFGLFLLAVSKIAAKQEATGKNNEKVVIIFGIGALILFNIMNVCFLYTDFNKIENLSSVSIDFMQLIFAAFGVFMIVIGNIMPKLRMNSIVGLRTTWSLKNETTWKKSQRFGGISFIIMGIIIVLICIFTSGWLCFALVMGVLFITVIVDVVYSYRIVRKY